MKRLLALALLLASLVSPAAAQEARIAAVVNDEIISMPDLAARMHLVIASSRLPDTPETRQRIAPQVLRILVDEKLEMQEAKRLNIKVSDEEVKTAIARIEAQNHLPKGGLDGFLTSHGIDRSTLVDQVTATLAWGKVVKQDLNQIPPVSEDEIDAALARLREQENQPRVRVAEIFLSVDNPSQDDEVHRFADRLYEQLHGGADFGALARQFSRSPSAAVGGDLGWTTTAQLSSEIARAVEAMRPGELSQPIHGPGGWYLVLLLDRQAPGGGGADDATVSLAQVMFPLVADAPPAARQEMTAKAAAATKDAKSCGELIEIGRRVAPQTSGDLGKIKIKDLPEPLRQTVAALKVAEPSAPVPVRGGIGVLMVCSKEGGPTALPTHDEVADTLFRERFDNLARRYLRDLRRAAYVDIRG